MPQPGPHRQEIGGVAPDLSLPLVSGGTETLDSAIAGRRGAVVVFWSGVCSHCIRYDAYFNDFETRHPSLALIGVAARVGETFDQIRQTVAERRLDFPIFHSADGAAAAAWSAQQTPRVYLIGPDRRLHYRGAIDNFKYPHDAEYEPYLEPAIEAFLAGRPIARPETASFGCAIQSVYYILPKTLRGHAP